jgi:hypothetical protein
MMTDMTTYQWVQLSLVLGLAVLTLLFFLYRRWVLTGGSSKMPQEEEGFVVEDEGEVEGEDEGEGEGEGEGKVQATESEIKAYHGAELTPPRLSEAVFKDTFQSIFRRPPTDLETMSYMALVSEEDDGKTTMTLETLTLLLNEKVKVDRVVEDAFWNLLKRLPTPEERAETTQWVTQDDLTVKGLMAKMRKTSSYSALVAEAENAADDTTEAFSNKDADAKKATLLQRLQQSAAMIQAFQKVLQRIPTKEELASYRPLMTDDVNNTQALVAALMATDEYMRLQKLQSNSVRSSSSSSGKLTNNITEAEIRLRLEGLVERVYGGGSGGGGGAETTPRNLAFLKSKYLQYHMNDRKMEAFLRMMQAVDSASDSVKLENLLGAYGQQTSTALQQVERFDQAHDDDLEPEPEPVAERMHDRNIEELQNACIRNSYYQKRDKEMSAFPPGPSPRRSPPVQEVRAYNAYEEGGRVIKAASDGGVTGVTGVTGTRLTDARDTQVGSILPRFMYKELED